MELDDNSDWLNTVWEELKEKQRNADAFLEIYAFTENRLLQRILSSVHAELIDQIKALNNYLPTKGYSDHFPDIESREFIDVIDDVQTIEEMSKGHSIQMSLTPEWKKRFDWFSDFMAPFQGSEIPQNTSKIEIPYTSPIFVQLNSYGLGGYKGRRQVALRALGEGSYAKTFKYVDPVYNEKFVLKRFKNELNQKERERFRHEFSLLYQCSSPYVVRVYKMTDTPKKLEYTMEFMTENLEMFLKKNPTLSISKRINIVHQFIAGMKYIHSRNILHRDISPTNILIKHYDDVNIVKLSDFGLSKSKQYTNLTSALTEVKGSFNQFDSDLQKVGFKNYGREHEICAMTLLIFYVMTGRRNMTRTDDLDATVIGFLNKGMNSDTTKRYKSDVELREAFDGAQW